MRCPGGQRRLSHVLRPTATIAACGDWSRRRLHKWCTLMPGFAGLTIGGQEEGYAPYRPLLCRDCARTAGPGRDARALYGHRLGPETEDHARHDGPAGLRDAVDLRCDLPAVARDEGRPAGDGAVLARRAEHARP